jgi:hypothetical protein
MLNVVMLSVVAPLRLFADLKNLNSLVDQLGLVVNVVAPSSLKGAAAFWPKGTQPNAPYRETQLIFFTFCVQCYETFYGRNLRMFVIS